MSRKSLFDNRIKKYAYYEVSEIYQALETSPDGLSHEQVEEMRQKYGMNRLSGQKNDTIARRLWHAFVNPFHVILFVLGIISLMSDVFLGSSFSKNNTTAVIIFFMIGISGIIRSIQELRAKSAAAQLDRLIHYRKTTGRKSANTRGRTGGGGRCPFFCGGSCSSRYPADRGHRPFYLAGSCNRGKCDCGKEQPETQLCRPENADPAGQSCVYGNNGNQW